MRAKKITVGLFLLFLTAMLLGTLVPKADFSETEKRYLATFPKLSWEAVTSGQWGEELEGWMADHLPFRSFFVGVDAYKNLLLGQQGEIRVLNGRLVEEPVQADWVSITGKLNSLNRFADCVAAPVTLALVPSAGWAGNLEGCPESWLIPEIYAKSRLNTINLNDVYANRPELYYRTDHHWTSRGAFLGYQAIASALGKKPVGEDAFDIEGIPDCFQGSTYSRSALWLTKPESLELWHGSEVAVTTSENTTEVFARNRLDEADKYTVFLDGNHALVRISNPAQSGTLLVIRDSYSNCLGPFLAESWGEVILVDLRYYRQPVSQLAQEADEILVLYSIGNFLTDGNLALLR